MTLTIRANFVHTPGLGSIQVLLDHLIELDSDGFIVSFGPYDGQDLTDAVQVPEGSFLLPTFCDLHLHAPQFLYQGTGLHLPLMEWLNEYAFKAEEKLDADLDLAERVYRRLARRLIESGTGAVSLFGTINEETNLVLAKVMKEAGLRAFIGKLSMDTSSRPSYVEASAQASLDSAISFVERCYALDEAKGPRLIEPILTPRFVPTCSDALLQGLGELAAQGKNSVSLRIQSHLAESEDQVAWVRSTRRAEDFDVFDKHRLLTPRTIQAHCTFLPPPSLDRMSQTGAAVAHCPLSNAYFSSTEIFRLREALDRGVKVGLGSDIAGGYELGIQGVMRMSVAVSRLREGLLKRESQALKVGAVKNPRIDWKESLYLATKGGAEAMGIHRGSGWFNVGAPFDAQQIRFYDQRTGEGVGALDFLDHDDKSQPKLVEDVIEKWWCLGDVRNRVAVWVQGNPLL
ncbi:hypothetical protein BJ322DRAFT_1008461 [Thelephora terrestris]|uniref:Amidohydrolase-related domain-containing protein n=1 Tax=Thelephora terrestris TaxID=56493 RepID=A0A9P6HBB4_9AGAM|nr:hypothetical protein BJ322DRAFT_1008461 [Thelephora terrestris]